MQKWAIHIHIRNNFDIFWSRFTKFIEIWWVPDKTEVGIECCKRRMNLNILSSAGRNPSLSAIVTIASPAGGTKTNRPKTIAAVVFNPSFELPGPTLMSQKQINFELTKILKYLDLKISF